MKKLSQARQTRRKKKFLLYYKKGNQFLWLFRLVVTEQIYDGSKWRFNPYLDNLSDQKA
jgi:hypothetical protein